MEGVAGEVAALRSAFPNSLVWGVSARDARWISWKHGICFNPRLYWAFRIMTGLWQRRINVNHLFGSVGDWHHLKSLINRPTIMTVCLRGRAEHSQLLERVDRFAVEWPGAKGDLKALGVGEDRIRLVLPPVDLSRFRADARPPDQFSVLFASSPDRAEWLESRGVDLILDAAQQCPEMRFVLVWRPWGDSLPAIRQLVANRGLKNVEIVTGKHADMSSFYQNTHVTVAPFRDGTRSKPTPNSILESLSSGRPVVVSDAVGISEMIADARAGLVSDPKQCPLSECLNRIKADWLKMSEHARRLAEAAFDMRRFVKAYESLYEEIA